MRQKNQPKGSGQQLLADFQTAFVSRATIDAAKYEADRSESELVEQLTHVSGGGYLRPGQLGADLQNELTRESLDAHIKKVQARQLDVISGRQLEELLEQAQATYQGRKVVVTVVPDKRDVVESIWFDNRKGYTSGVVTKKSITGIIDEVLLHKNVLSLRPTRAMHLLNGNLQNYLVYVIDPETLMPMVSFELL